MEALKYPVRRRYETGAELVEFALVLPILLFVMIGIFDFGFMFRDYGVITNAAREGARIGVLSGYGTLDIQNRASSYLTAAGLTAGLATTTVAFEDLEVNPVTHATVRTVRVTVTYPHSFSLLAPIGRFVGSTLGSITMTAVSTMRVEAPA